MQPTEELSSEWTGDVSAMKLTLPLLPRCHPAHSLKIFREALIPVSERTEHIPEASPSLFAKHAALDGLL